MEIKYLFLFSYISYQKENVEPFVDQYFVDLKNRLKILLKNSKKKEE
jgi:hypothetical protein